MIPARARLEQQIRRLRSFAAPVLAAFTAAVLLAGVGAWLVSNHAVAQTLWIAGTIAAIGPAVLWVVSALRQRRVGVDLIAVLSLGGTLLVGEYLAGAVIAVMLAGGRALDSAATRRASKDITALANRMPRIARRQEGAHVAVVSADDISPGDVLVIAAGDVVPVDGRVDSAHATLDESALTGESAPVERIRGDRVRSGVANAGSTFTLAAISTTETSTYTAIVHLAQSVGAESARVVRLADRIAGFFLVLAIVTAGIAWLQVDHRYARSRYSWWPRLARSCWQLRSLSFPVYRGHLVSG